MYQAGLVLEGGGMKGVYSSGVLDFFLLRRVCRSLFPVQLSVKAAGQGLSCECGLSG